MSVCLLVYRPTVIRYYHGNVKNFIYTIIVAMRIFSFDHNSLITVGKKSLYEKFASKFSDKLEETSPS